MTWISDLIENMPQLVGYLAPGFLLVSAFLWTTNSKIESGTVFLVMAIVSSYLIRGIICVDYDSLSYFAQTVICVVCFVLGVFAAVFIKSEFFNDLLADVGIKRTTNQSLWDDVIGEGSVITIYDPKERKYYCGAFKYQQMQDGIAYIVICAYYVANERKEVLENYTGTERKLMIKQKKADFIMISKDDPFGHYEFHFS